MSEALPARDREIGGRLKYLCAAHVLFVHSRLIDLYGGEPGLVHAAALCRALNEPREVFFGRVVDRKREDKAAALLHALVRQPLFKCHNDRLAIACTLLFLFRNGRLVRLTARDITRVLHAVRDHEMTVSETGSWLRKRAHIEASR